MRMIVFLSCVTYSTTGVSCRGPLPWPPTLMLSPQGLDSLRRGEFPGWYFINISQQVSVLRWQSTSIHRSHRSQPPLCHTDQLISSTYYRLRDSSQSPDWDWEITWFFPHHLMKFSFFPSVCSSISLSLSLCLNDCGQVFTHTHTHLLLIKTPHLHRFSTQLSVPDLVRNFVSLLGLTRQQQQY